jgi:ubiquinone/menaquinone biosynthesis C-methylase UbiE
MERSQLESATGKLFSGLWTPYDEKLFEESVALFAQRLKLANFDETWFKGKTVLDAGCGGGRNTIAMARLGAAKACGVDIGEGGIADARKRAANLDNAEFKVGSILSIPYPDATFDLVWCAGVLMITDDENQALNELTRVLKPGGKLYLLVYATGGMRWPLIEMLRPIAEQIGQDSFEKAAAACSMPSNKRRTFMDDLFCPKLDFYHWDRLRRMLDARGFKNIDRWGTAPRLDHEANLGEYHADLLWLYKMFEAGERDNIDGFGSLYGNGRQATQATLDAIQWFDHAVKEGRLGEAKAMDVVMGQGHHRVLSVKS